MKDDKENLKSKSDSISNAADLNNAQISSAAPAFNPTAQLKSSGSSGESIQLQKAPFQMKGDEEEEELQMKKAPFQMKMDEEEEELQM